VYVKQWNWFLSIHTSPSGSPYVSELTGVSNYESSSFNLPRFSLDKSRVAKPRHFNADPDPSFHFIADPDLAPHQSDAKL
jgi:hypothetical protein